MLAIMWIGIGTALAAISWNSFLTPVCALLLPVAWMLAERPLSVWLLTLSYYLFSSRLLLTGSVNFASTTEEAALLIVGWMSFCATLASIWTIGWLWGSRSQLSRLILCLAIEVILVLPPLWILGMAHPIYGIGYLTPGLGWVGVLIGFVAPGLIGHYIGHLTHVPRVVLLSLLLTILLITSTYQVSAYNAVQIKSVNTRWSAQADTAEVGRRTSIIHEEVKRTAGDPQITTLVYPETALGTTNEGTELIVRQGLTATLKTNGITLIVGLNRIAPNGPRVSALVLYPSGRSIWIDARQPMPVALWRPWKRWSFEPDWSRPSDVELPNGQVSYLSICFEDVMPGLFLYRMLNHQPDAIISIANNWWMSNDDEINLQWRHIDSMALLFNIPLSRSVNTPIVIQ